MQQKRLLIALVLSSVILFLWSYLFPVAPPPKPNAATAPSATPSPTSSQTVNSSTPAAPAPVSTAGLNTAQRIVTIRTPLYDAKFDTLGAQPVRWIIQLHKNR